MIRILTNDLDTDSTLLSWLVGWNVGIRQNVVAPSGEGDLLVEGRFLGTAWDDENRLCYEVAPVVGDDGWDTETFDEDATELHPIDDVTLEVF